MCTADQAWRRAQRRHGHSWHGRAETAGKQALAGGRAGSPQAGRRRGWSDLSARTVRVVQLGERQRPLQRQAVPLPVEGAQHGQEAAQHLGSRQRQTRVDGRRRMHGVVPAARHPRAPPCACGLRQRAPAGNPLPLASLPGPIHVGLASNTHTRRRGFGAHVQRRVQVCVVQVEDVEDEHFQGVRGNQAVVRPQQAALVVAPRLELQGRDGRGGRRASSVRRAAAKSRAKRWPPVAASRQRHPGSVGACLRPTNPSLAAEQTNAPVGSRSAATLRCCPARPPPRPPTHQQYGALEQVLPANAAVGGLQESDGAQASHRVKRHVHNHVARHALDQLDLDTPSGRGGAGVVGRPKRARRLRSLLAAAAAGAAARSACQS